MSASTLRNLLKQVDLSAPSIQGSAGAMMKHYDKSPGVAVVEWRNALQQASSDQYLPLLYVANEVLQNSKRNRGNKFLEEFSPILGQSLVYISQRTTPQIVEKIRRTIKIWGDRYVFSIRYVNELLQGLEPYRHGNNGQHQAGGMGSSNNNTSTQVSSLSSPKTSPQSITPGSMHSNGDTSQPMAMDTSNDKNDSGLNDEDDIDDLFGNASNKLLKIDVDLDQAAIASSAASKKKRRRSEDGIGKKGKNESQSHFKKSKRRSILSTNSLMELWNQVTSLQMSYDRVQGALKEITAPEYIDEDAVSQQIDTLVGDELLNEYKKTVQYQENIANYRRELYNIAQKRKALENEAIRYLPWLETALKQDEEDIKFCKKYTEQLRLFEHVHKPARIARDIRLGEEMRRRKEEEELRKKKEEEEERKKFMESAMSKQTEAKPGMVWNKATGEYQYLNQDESWRD